MPEKSVPISNISINFIMVAGVIFTLVSSYITILIKNVIGKIDRVNDRVENIKEDIKGHRDMHNDHYDRLKDLETVQAVLKTEHDDLRAEHKERCKK